MEWNLVIKLEDNTLKKTPTVLQKMKQNCITMLVQQDNLHSEQGNEYCLTFDRH